MKARDIINESQARVQRRTPGELKTTYDYASTGAVTGKGMDRYYDLYRASMMMGRVPADITVLDQASWMNNRGYIGYTTQAERDKIEAAFKALGLEIDELVGPGSQEPPDTNSESPIQPFKGYNT